MTDHFSGAVDGAPWSRDPFVTLGAMAAVTERIELGLLVANMVNRHPVQLVSAFNSLQSIAPGRVRLGLGSGAAPGSRFAVEHEAIGRDLGRDRRRSTRSALRDQIRAVRAIYAGAESFDSPTAVVPTVCATSSTARPSHRSWSGHRRGRRSRWRSPTPTA